jgi:hypothetical protein
VPRTARRDANGIYPRAHPPQDTTLSHSDIAWNFDKFGINPTEDFKYGREPDHLRRRRLEAKSEFDDSQRRHLQGGSVGPPPVNLGYNPPLVWNQRMFFLLNNYQGSIPHSYNIPEQYFRSEACALPYLVASPCCDTG